MTKLENSICYQNGNSCAYKQHEDDNFLYRVVSLTKDDEGKAVEFLQKYFLKDEPLNVAVGLKASDESHARLLTHCVQFISEGFSLAAVSDYGDILGLCLNRTLIKENNDDCDRDNGECIFDNNKFEDDAKADRIMYLLDTLKEKTDLFGQFPNADKVLDIFIVSVDDTYRGKGICKALIDKTRVIAKQNNFPLIKVDCTSHFTAKAASRLGFKCIYSLPYDSVVDTEGHPVVKPDLPHVCAETYVTLV